MMIGSSCALDGLKGESRRDHQHQSDENEERAFASHSEPPLVMRLFFAIWLTRYYRKFHRSVKKVAPWVDALTRRGWKRRYQAVCPVGHRC